jgi:sec-independent protein translocase protein TatA
MPGGIGLPELIIVLVILLVIFGPKRLPGLGRSLGSGMREFKDSITGRTKDEEEDDEPRQLDPPAAVSSEQRAADERVTEPRA